MMASMRTLLRANRYDSTPTSKVLGSSLCNLSHHEPHPIRERHDCTPQIIKTCSQLITFF